MPVGTTTVVQPAVHLTQSDYDRLAPLADGGAAGAALLDQELQRAVIIKDSDRPTAFARLGSWVEYTDLLSGRTRKVQIVTPEAADADQGRVSVLTPVGAALIGLKPGARFALGGEDGRPRVLVIGSVEHTA